MHTQGFHHLSLNLAEIMSSDGSPKGRMRTMRRWPFEPWSEHPHPMTACRRGMVTEVPGNLSP